jgi:predicted Zn-dependent protease
LRAGDLAEAETLYRSALAADPDSLAAKLYLGITLHLRGAWSAAAEVLREAARREPTLWPASLFLARCAERLGDTATVRQSYGMALAARDVSPRELGIDPCEDLEEWQGELMAAAAQRLARWREEK